MSEFFPSVIQRAICDTLDKINTGGREIWKLQHLDCVWIMSRLGMAGRDEMAEE